MCVHSDCKARNIYYFKDGRAYCIEHYHRDDPKGTLTWIDQLLIRARS